MKPLISIIIPCFNTAEYLPQCMASLEKQTIGFEKLNLYLWMMRQQMRGRHGGVFVNLSRDIPKRLLQSSLRKICLKVVLKCRYKLCRGSLYWVR